MRLHTLLAVGLLSVTAHFALAQSGLACAAAQRSFESIQRKQWLHSLRLFVVTWPVLVHLQKV